MYVKIHETAEGRIIAACDSNLIGKKLIEGIKVIDLDRYRNFYIGIPSDEKTLAEHLKKTFNSANIVGRNSVKVALDLGLITKAQVGYIKKVPYAQIYNL